MACLIMRLSCVALTFTILLAACSTPLYRPISKRAENELARRTLSPDETKNHIIGADAVKVAVTGPELISLPLTFQQRCPFVPVAVNGLRPRLFLFDTGAGISVLQSVTALKSKATLLSSQVLPLKGQGIAGSEPFLGSLVHVQIGQLGIENMPAFVRKHRNDLAILGPWITQSLDVDILGYNPLSKFCTFLTLDYRAQRLTLGAKTPFTPPPGVRPIPLIRRGGLPYVRLSSGSVHWDALVDSGSSFGIELPVEVAKRLDLEKDAIPVADDFQYGIGGQVDVQKAGIRVTRIPRLEGLGAPLEDYPVSIRPDLALIGSHFLRQFRVTFDFRNSLLYLER